MNGMEVTVEEHRTTVSSLTEKEQEQKSSGRCCKALFIFLLVAGVVITVTVLAVRVNAVDSDTTGELQEDSLTSSSPTLSGDELAISIEEYEARRDAARAARDDPVMRAYRNESVSEEWVLEEVSTLKEDEVADFRIMNLIRLLAYTDGEFDDMILPTLKEITSWPAEGNSNTVYVYWSENHIAMWLCIIQITHEWYGWPVQEGHDFRLKFFLEQKIKHGFIEFFSSVYMPFTFAALATLYDFSSDVEIRELAEGAAIRLLQDLDLITNESGGLFSVAGRSYKEYVESSEHTLHTMGWLLTDRGGDLDVRDAAFSPGAIALATTTLDVTQILERPLLQADLVRTSGHSLDDFHREWEPLGVHDRQLVAMSMGGYAHPDYVGGLFATLNYYDLWDSKYFRDFERLSWMPPGALRFGAKVSSTYGAGTLLYTQIVLHKYKSTMLSTLQNYHAGLNGEQQWPFVATAGTGAVYIGTGELSRNPSAHFPNAKQRENVALLAYSPNSDLEMFGENLDVTLVWPEDSFSETVEQGNWLVGRENSGFVAVYRSCLDTDANGFTSCSATQQVWACVVGHEDTHGTFEEFVAMLDASTVDVTFEKRFISANIQASGQDFSLEWQQESVAPAKLALIISIVFLLLILAGTIFVCVYASAPDASEKDLADKKGNCCLRSRVASKSGTCICLTWVLVGTLFVLGLIAVLLLATESHRFPTDSEVSQLENVQ